VRCQECRKAADEKAEGWRAYRDDDHGGPEPLVVFYCPGCAEREFGPVRSDGEQEPKVSNETEIDENPNGNPDLEDEEANKVEGQATIDSKSIETRVHDWTSLTRRVRRR
jgi:hypothetical protein